MAKMAMPRCGRSWPGWPCHIAAGHGQDGHATSEATIVMKDLFARARQNGETHPWLIAFTVMLAVFMEVLDTSVANVALPHISGNLSAGVDESTWVLTSYLVSNAIVLPLTGWFSSLFGRKRFYMA